jgi:hypothetical protein
MQFALLLWQKVKLSYWRSSFWDGGFAGLPQIVSNDITMLDHLTVSKFYGQHYFIMKGL